MQGSAHEANNYLVQNVSSARVKKLWVNDAFIGNILCMYEISPLFFFNWWLKLTVRLKRIVYERRQPQTINCLIIKKFLEELTEVSIIINKI